MSSNPPSKTKASAPSPAPKPASAKPVTPPTGARSAPVTSPETPSGPVPPLFRRIDWFTFWLVTLLTLAGYLYTVAPDLTLEDSGELAVGSMYAGVPHPPGYPVWTLYTWAFTKLLPFSNIAWRVAVSSAVAAAFACGICGLLVSRGSSMILESIDWFKELEETWERRICVVSGIVGGLLLGFNGYIWSQAVIVEVYTLSVLSLMAVLATLLRWMYAPHQWRYLYWSMFWFGISFCNHQTVIVAAMGVELAVAAADPKLGRNAFWVNSLAWLGGLFMHFTGRLHTFTENPGIFGVFNMVGILSLITAVYLTYKTNGISGRWLIGIVCVLLVAAGSAFYFYMPLASMTNPPLNWGYPRTWEGFVHAFTRGQYEKTTPSSETFAIFRQMWIYTEGAQEEFNFTNLMIGLVPFLFWNRMGKRERAWLIGLSGIYLCLAVLLTYLLAPTGEKQTRELVKVFFTSSHVVIALAIGYGLSIVAACIRCRYAETRYWLWIGAAVACGFNLYEVAQVFGDTQFAILRIAALISVGLSVVFLALVLLQRQTAKLAPFLAVFLLIPADSILSHWSDNEQRGHLFGFWFGHDMFDPTEIKGKDGKPIYPEMTRDAVLFGGTDPGRFNPTYMIFCESFIKPEQRRNPKFDRRDVALITQNALADLTYLNYIRAHYNRSAQIDPPFFQEMPFIRSESDRALGRTNLLMKLVRPLDRFFLKLGDDIEFARRSGPALFNEKSFKDAAGLAAKIRSSTDPLSVHLRDRLTGTSGAASSLAGDLNRVIKGDSIYSQDRFRGINLTDRTRRFAMQNPTHHNRARLNRLLLEEAYPGMIEPSTGGVYPDLEVITPTAEDSARCFNDYMVDARNRLQNRMLKPGENVQQTPDGRVSVSGQVAVMAINALLCRVIFDANPQNEFFIEESFPLDWMFPYLTPFGIIMKINRLPVAEVTEDMVQKDHEFWSQYSERFIGNWITYDTSVKEICDFAIKTYKKRDLSGFKGKAEFVRDDNAQKAFSKLRGAIGGVYAWRVSNTGATNAVEQARLIKEADFAFKQSFAFCPYSPEAVFRYANMLIGLRRYEDALLIAKTAFEFDDENASVRELVRGLEQYVANPGAAAASSAPVAPKPATLTVEEWESRYAANRDLTENAFGMASAYSKAGRQADADRILQAILANPKSSARDLLLLAETYRQRGNIASMEQAVFRYATIESNSAEAWYDLAAVQAAQGKGKSAGESVSRALGLSDRRLKADPAAFNLRSNFAKDSRFSPVRQNPDFTKAVTAR